MGCIYFQINTKDISNPSKGLYIYDPSCFLPGFSLRYTTNFFSIYTFLACGLLSLLFQRLTYLSLYSLCCFQLTPSHCVLDWVSPVFYKDPLLFLMFIEGPVLLPELGVFALCSWILSGGVSVIQSSHLCPWTLFGTPVLLLFPSFCHQGYITWEVSPFLFSLLSLYSLLCILKQGLDCFLIKYSSPLVLVLWCFVTLGWNYSWVAFSVLDFFRLWFTCHPGLSTSHHALRFLGPMHRCTL